MAADLNINKQTGQAAIFYAGNEVPWHGLGVNLKEPATAKECSS